MNSPAQKITRTALFLALSLLFQALRFIPAIAAWPQNSFLIGSLVNLVLFLSTGMVGLFSGLVVAIATPLVALLQGHMPVVLMLPVTLIGNILLVLLFYYGKKLNKYAAVAVSACLKWVFMFYGGKFLFLVFMPNMPAQKLEAVLAMLNVPQLVTALIGGFLALFMMARLPNAAKQRRK